MLKLLKRQKDILEDLQFLKKALDDMKQGRKTLNSVFAKGGREDIEGIVGGTAPNPV